MRCSVTKIGKNGKVTEDALVFENKETSYYNAVTVSMILHGYTDIENAILRKKASEEVVKGMFHYMTEDKEGNLYMLPIY